MPVRFIKNDQEITSPDELHLSAVLENTSQELVLEWLDGQYWLHSDIPNENPIGIEIDKILTRHEEFFRKSSLQKELLAKAIGIKGAHRPKMTDLTAGFLGDTLLFLAFGCQVQALERNPLIAFLIRSALANAQHPKLSQLSFQEGNALELLSHGAQSEVIYFDPMFEDANAKASPRKEMRIFRNVIGEDLDAEEVFTAALKARPKRLVVKRPRLSRSLSQLKAVEFNGKATRYDVYFPFDSNPLK